MSAIGLIPRPFLVPSAALLLFAHLTCVGGLGPDGDPSPKARPRFIVTTDINVNAGDPDDRQSLAHVLWYADDLDIRGIVVDRPEAGGALACEIIYALYDQDHRQPGARFRELGFPPAEYFRSITRTNRADATRLIIEEGRRDVPRPLWLLAWGNLHTVAAALNAMPDIVPRVRLLSIGTHLLSPADKGDGRKPNWNGPGRDFIWSKYSGLWWIESDWTYNGMFDGPEAVALKETLSREGGALGRHIKDVMATVDWADYFRAGDTPTVLYLIDPGHSFDDPTQPSWAGRFVRPFPQERPHHWTDVPGDLPWDYANPTKTWTNAPARYAAAKQTLRDRRPAMYAALLEKVRRLYPEVGRINR